MADHGESRFQICGKCIRLVIISAWSWNGLLHAAQQTYTDTDTDTGISHYNWIWNGFYFIWPLRKHAANKQTTREPAILSPNETDRAKSVKVLQCHIQCQACSVSAQVYNSLGKRWNSLVFSYTMYSSSQIRFRWIAVNPWGNRTL